MLTLDCHFPTAPMQVPPGLYVLDIAVLLELVTNSRCLNVFLIICAHSLCRGKLHSTFDSTKPNIVIFFSLIVPIMMFHAGCYICIFFHSHFGNSISVFPFLVEAFDLPGKSLLLLCGLVLSILLMSVEFALLLFFILYFYAC